MWFWWFMFLCDLLIPLLMIICGRMMWENPPKRINSIIGYRTPRAMKNIDTWNFAHHYCGRLWWKLGWIMFIPSILVPLPCYHRLANMIGIVSGILCTVQCVIMILSIIPTETALKRTFTDEGIRR